MSIHLYCALEARAAAAVSRPRGRGLAEWICLEEECRRECLCRCRADLILLCAFRFSLKSPINRHDDVACTYSQKPEETMMKLQSRHHSVIFIALLIASVIACKSSGSSTSSTTTNKAEPAKN